MQIGNENRPKEQEESVSFNRSELEIKAEVKKEKIDNEKVAFYEEKIAFLNQNYTAQINSLLGQIESYQEKIDFLENNNNVLKQDLYLKERMLEIYSIQLKESEQFQKNMAL